MRTQQLSKGERVDLIRDLQERKIRVKLEEKEIELIKSKLLVKSQRTIEFY